MGFIGKQPTPAPLTASDITDGIITSAKIADGTIATADISDSAVTKVKTSGVTSDMFRNRIINGDISVSQRGTSFSDVASGDYTIDRWKMNYRAIGNADISQVDNKTYKSLKVLNSNASTQEIIMGTRIEDITQFNNESFVLSFYAKASASCTLDTRVFENYGSGGSSTVTRVASGSQNKTITTSRQRFSITFTPSDMSSLTIGTSNFLEINFSVSLAASAYWEYDSVQLEKGTTATDFEFIPFDVNLFRCQRYFTVINNNARNGDAFFCGFTASSTAISGVGYSLATPLRIGNPTITKNSSVPMQRCTVDGFQTLGAGAGTIGLTAEAANSYTLCINLGGFSGMTGSRPAVVSFPAATNAVTIDAEL